MFESKSHDYDIAGLALMKKYLFIFFLSFLYISVFPQKVGISLVKSGDIALSEFQILDDQQQIIISGKDYAGNDSISFGLESDKRYFLKVFIFEVLYPDTVLYSLHVGGEPVIAINSSLGQGEYSFPFFTGVKQEQSKITGGTPTDISQFPWMVYFRSDIYGCGGAIIDGKWILTAAHCTRNDNNLPISPSLMSVTVGSTDPLHSSAGKKYFVSEVIVHEEYNSSTLDNDIALLKLTDSINFSNAKPIKIITSKNVSEGATDPGVMAWLAGWGLIKVTPNTYPGSLQKVQLPVISTSQASVVYNYIPSTDIMAGYKNGNKDACNGDSGGPLIVPVEDEYKIAGIVSWGSNSCNTYGGYTRVSLFEDWIRTNTGIQYEYIPPVPAGDTLICEGTYSGIYSAGELVRATSFEWVLSPSEAGSITGEMGKATVIWNPSFVGSAFIKYKVNISGTDSEWSKLSVKKVLNTRLIGNSSDTTLCAESPLNISVTASGNNLIYNWYKENNLIKSEISGNLYFAKPETSNSGRYICQLKGSCGTIYSSAINIIVLPLTVISYSSPDTQAENGDDIEFEVIADGHELGYQWRKEDKMIPGNDFPQLFLQNVTAKDIGLYKVTVTGTCGTETSRSIYLYSGSRNDSEIDEAILWPSVTSDFINVALSNSTSYEIRIFDTNGKVLNILRNCQYQKVIDIHHYPRGLYIVKISNGVIQKSFRVIKI